MTPLSPRARYNQAHYDYQCRMFPSVVKDGHYTPPVFPKLHTDKGFKDFIANFLKWSGHFANITHNKGWAKEKTAPKYNLLTGTVQQVLTGKKQWNFSSGTNGMQDVDANLKHPNHKFGIPWKIECKTPNDWTKDNQIEYGDMVMQTGAIWSVVKSAEDFFAQYDKIMNES